MPYNYDTPTTPQPVNFRRITTDGYFTFDGDTKTGDLKLGSITMSALKHGNTEVEVSRAFKGSLQRVDIATSEVKPEYDLTLNEYTPDLVPVYLFGTPGPDLVQAAAQATSVNFASVNIRRSYRLGARLVSNVVVKVANVVKLQDIDYQLDSDKGIITIMDGGGIADAAAVTVTFDNAATTLKTSLPYTRLGVYGFLRLYEEDAQSNNPRSEIYFRCKLTPTDFGDGDPKKYSESKLKCAVLGAMTRRDR